MRVLMVSGTGVHPGIGGQGTFCANLSAQLRRHGVSVAVEGPPAWHGFCAEHGIPWYGHGQAQPRAFDLVHVNGPGLRALRQAHEWSRPAVVTHEDYSAVCADSAAYADGACSAGPRPGPCAGCPRQSLRDRLWLTAFRALLCEPGVAGVAISHAVARRLGPLATDVIHHPVEPLTPSPQPAKGFERTVAFAGRLVAHKGVQVVLEALSTVPDARLTVAGDGPARAMLQARAMELGVADRTEFLGMVPLAEVMALYRKAALVVIPSSYDEPFGYALAEAMAMGKPVVASNRGAFPELCGEGRGWLCERDHAPSFARAIHEALEDAAERERRGNAAWRFTRDALAPPHAARKYLEVYGRLLTGRAAKHA